MIEVELPNGATVDVPERVNGFVFEQPADDPEAGLGQGPTVVARWVDPDKGHIVAVKGRGTNYRAFYWPRGSPNARRTLHGPVGGVEVLRKTAETVDELANPFSGSRDDEQPSLTQSSTSVTADTGGTVDVVSRARPLTPMAQDKLQDYSPIAEITAGEIENPPLGVADDTLVGYRLGEMPSDEFFNQHQLDIENNTIETQDNSMSDFNNERMRDAHYWSAQARGFMQQESSASVQSEFRVAILAGDPIIFLRDFEIPDGNAIASELATNGFPNPIAVKEFDDGVKLVLEGADDSRLPSPFVDDWRDFESNTEFDDDSRGIEETPAGTAAMQEAGMQDNELRRDVRVIGEPESRRYDFDDGTDSRKEYIPPSAFMDAIDAIEDELGDANQYVAGGDAGTVVFTQGDGFENYEFNRPERDDRYPFDDQQDDTTETDLGALEPEVVDPDPDPSPTERTTQGTLGGDDPMDPGEFPTKPDAEAKRKREQLRREEQQESLEGDAPEFDPKADREAQERRQRRAERTADEIADDQADLTGDPVDADEVRETPDDDDDQAGLAAFADDPNGNGNGNGGSGN